MDREELIRKLDANFSLAARQDNDPSGKGYRIHLRAAWNSIDCKVRSFRVQLVGLNPLTGEDLDAKDIKAVFTFDKKEYYTKNLLTYHGKFSLKCTAVLSDGEEIIFRMQELDLNYPNNKPEIVYTVKESQGFRLFEIKSNCWGNCRGKMWINIDGHDQRIDIPAGTDKMVRFYIPAVGDYKITVQDENVILRKGR